jgi:uncharacterized protein (DUF305 family)
MLHPRTALSSCAIAAFLMACSSADNAATDTAAMGSGVTASAIQAPASPAASRPAPTEPEHDFLRKMIDHHEGMIQMATAAMSKGANSTTQGDAHNLHTKQADEQKKMIAEVQAKYSETVTPMIMPSHKAMADSLALKTGTEYDRTFYRLTVQHHREGVQMVDEMLPRFTRADVRQMAEKMRADQQKEITEFQRKAGT